MSSVDDVQAYDTAAEGVLAQWAQKDGSAASGWLISQYNGKRKPQLIEIIASSWYWAGNDPRTVENWVRGFADQDERDHGWVGIFARLDPLSTDYRRVFEYIQTPELRERALRSAVSRQKLISKSNAQQFLDDTMIDEVTRAELQVWIDQ